MRAALLVAATSLVALSCSPANPRPTPAATPSPIPTASTATIEQISRSMTVVRRSGIGRRVGVDDVHLRPERRPACVRGSEGLSRLDPLARTRVPGGADVHLDPVRHPAAVDQPPPRRLVCPGDPRSRLPQ